MSPSPFLNFEALKSSMIIKIAKTKSFKEMADAYKEMADWIKSYLKRLSGEDDN